jgi:hypothetical protein
MESAGRGLGFDGCSCLFCVCVYVCMRGRELMRGKGENQKKLGVFPLEICILLLFGPLFWDYRFELKLSELRDPR